jgi:quercetin dioxygenase-like cupin family protein
MQDYIFRKEVRPGIVVHTIGAAEKIMLCRVTLAKGAQLPEHAHPHEQASFVVSGRMTFEVAGVRKPCPAGTGIVFKANEPHSAVADDESVVSDVFTPPREDYLPA